jgi:beta-lactamase regulating signal transducer with metallopeptidase domain
VAPVGPVTLQRDQRVTVTVITNSRGVGITTLTARMLTQESRPFGENATFQVRTTQIGAVVWIVMAVGGAVLFIAAGRRIMLRVRGHRRRTRGIS